MGCLPQGLRFLLILALGGLYGIAVLLRMGELGLSLLAPAGEMSRLSHIAWQHVCALLVQCTELLPACSWLRVWRQAWASTGLLRCRSLPDSVHPPRPIAQALPQSIHSPSERRCPYPRTLKAAMGLDIGDRDSDGWFSFCHKRMFSVFICC